MFRAGLHFCSMFHQFDKIMQIRIFSIAIAFLASCQQTPDNIRQAVAGIAISEAGNNPVPGSQPHGVQPWQANAFMYKSSDGGQTWQNFTYGLPENMETGLVGTNNADVFLSADNTFYRINSNDPAAVWTQDQMINEAISGIFPGSTGAYISSMGVGFYREIAGADVWVAGHNALPDKSVRYLLEAPDNTLFVVCNSGIYKTDNGGKKWKKVFSGEDVFGLASAGERLFAGAGRGLLCSTDNGETWEFVLREGNPVIQVQPAGNGIIVICNVKNGTPWRTGIMDGSHNQMMFSADAGKTWQDLGQNLPQDSNIRSVTSWGKYLYCSLESGVFRSGDQGATWQSVLPASTNRYYTILVSGASLIAVSTSDGC